MADDDMGTAFLKNHMTEGQTSPDSPAMSASSPPGRGITGYGSKGIDMDKDDEYGSKSFTGASRRVNRRGKSDRL